jgi:hypothetical protein
MSIDMLLVFEHITIREYSLDLIMKRLKNLTATFLYALSFSKHMGHFKIYCLEFHTLFININFSLVFYELKIVTPEDSR